METGVLDVFNTNSALSPTATVSSVATRVLSSEHSLEDHALDEVANFDGDIIALLVVDEVVYDIGSFTILTNPLLPSLQRDRSIVRGSEGGRHPKNDIRRGR